MANDFSFNKNVKPIGMYCTIDDIVDAALLETFDDGNIMSERFYHWAWRGWKEEIIVDMEKAQSKRTVMLPVAASTKTVKLPQDYIDYTQIGILNPNLKLRNLSVNDNIVPYDIDDSATKDKCSCGCGCGDICSDMRTLSYVEEIVGDGTKITKTKTCSNGDVIQETTEPIQETLATTTCDITVNMNVDGMLCDYFLDLNSIENSEFTVTLVVNGVSITSNNLTNVPTTDEFFNSLGWRNSHLDMQYELNNSTDIYNTGVLIIFTDDNSRERFEIEKTCQTSNILTVFPYTITSYVKNGEILTTNTEITEQSDLDDFFDDLGFTKESDTVYSLTASEDTYGDFSISVTGCSTCSWDLTDMEPVVALEDCVEIPSNSEDEGIEACNDDTDWTTSAEVLVGINNHRGSENAFFYLDSEDSNIISIRCADFIYGDMSFKHDAGGTYQTFEVSCVAGETQTYSVTPTYECITNYTTTTRSQTRIETICNIELKACGCIADTPQNMETLSCCSCFGCYPVCWNSLWCDEQEEPYNSNPYGTFTILGESGIMQLNKHNTYSKIYLQYYSDGLLKNGNYYVHVYAKPALVAYAIWKSMEGKRNIAQWEKERKFQNWIGERGRCMRRLSRQSLFDLLDAVRTLPVI